MKTREVLSVVFALLGTVPAHAASEPGQPSSPDADRADTAASFRPARKVMRHGERDED